MRKDVYQPFCCSNLKVQLFKNFLTNCISMRCSQFLFLHWLPTEENTHGVALQQN